MSENSNVLTIDAPIVSIIVPVYNTSQYLDQCLESLVNQTFRDIEIICINDASTDNSLSILRKWEKIDNRIKIIDSEKNLRQGGARNLGLKIARGKYIGLVDSDDFVAKNMYEELISHSNNLSVDIVIGNNYCSYDGQEIIETFKNLNRWKDINEIKQLVTLYGCRMWTNILKKSLFLKNGLLYPECLAYEDNAIGVPLFLSAKTIRVVENTSLFYYYRINAMSTTRQKDNPRFFDRITTAKMMLTNTERLGLYDKYKNEIDYSFYKLYYENTLNMVWDSFRRFPAEKIREMMKEWDLLNIKIEANPYYKGTNKYLKLMVFFAKYPFFYLPYKRTILFLRRIFCGISIR